MIETFEWNSQTHRRLNALPNFWNELREVTLSQSGKDVQMSPDSDFPLPRCWRGLHLWYRVNWWVVLGSSSR